MRAIALITVAGLIGVSTAACTEDSYYNSRPQYVYSPTPYYSTAPTYYAPSSSPRGDRDGDGVPNYRDQRPSNPYRY